MKRRISFSGDLGLEKLSKRALVDNSSTKEDNDDDKYKVNDGRIRID
jgi:hypothetical protein